MQFNWPEIRRFLLDEPAPGRTWRPRHLSRRLRTFFQWKWWPFRIIAAFITFLLFNLLFPLPTEKTWSQSILASDGTLLNAYLTDDDKWRMFTTREEVAPEVVEALIVKEDRWFWIHPGINPLAIARAMGSNFFAGKRTSGASTITMQLARMMEPRPRTYTSKVIEMFRALQLEWKYSKTEILELYMSYLPYGGNVEGIKAASLIYFDRPPEKLSLSQAILLAVIPNRPNSLRLDRQPEAAKEARDRWVENFRNAEAFPEKDLDIALEEPIESERHQIEVRAPHFCQRVRARYGGLEDELVTTLDAEMQAIVQRLLKNYIERLKNRGVTNGAVLVLDNENGAVRAYCGSADFFDPSAAGQNDGVISVRSPGSTLKPSLYALAMDQGMLTPKSKLLDIPGNFGGYSPENYDLIFHGDVPLDFALMHSLNVPAVRVLDQVGMDAYLQLLEDAQMNVLLRQRASLGLSVILGGCGTDLEELTTLFSAFARQGWHCSPAWLVDPKWKPRDSTRIFSPAAAWMTAEMLSGIERPDIPNQYLNITTRSRIAWKTGTSYGRRDAWSIGFTPKHTIGIWVGNFDGTGAPDLSGTEMAVPLLFEVLEALEPSDAPGNQDWFPEPPDLYRRRVCVETGKLPGEHCTQTVPDFYIRNVSSREVCDLDQPVYTNVDTTLQFCTGCLPDSGYIKCTYPLYEPELALWYSENKVPYRQPPPHNPECEAVLAEGGPQILSPASDFEYLLEAGAGQQILLQATSDTRANQHYWFVDREFVGAVPPGERMFVALGRGKHWIVCRDDKGRETGLTIQVLMY